jgi:hypothetical protein
MKFLTPEKHELLVRGQCPDCGGRDFRLGPRGGLSRNILCVSCRTEFNHGPVMTERLGCDRMRQLEIYGIGPLLQPMFHLIVSDPLPKNDLEPDLASALRVVLGMGGVLRRESIGSDWKVGGIALNEQKVAALVDGGFLRVVWE